MRNVEALLLDEVLQIHHEQSATLGDNVVHIAGVLEGVGKLCRSETVHRVDDDLESEGQCLIVHTLLKERNQGSIQKLPSSFIVVMLDRYSGLLDLAETLSVSVSEEVETLD